MGQGKIMAIKKVKSAKNTPVFRFCRKVLHTKLQQITEKVIEHNRCTFFHGIWHFVRINSSGVKFVLYFILFSFYFLKIWANFPFVLVWRVYKKYYGAATKWYLKWYQRALLLSSFRYKYFVWGRRTGSKRDEAGIHDMISITAQ